uniref:Golgin subfamily A member 1 n=1 Tax=Scophthalmus maximus TaxID=52904 RepID=A0A8D3BTY0_SCOMX
MFAKLKKKIAEEAATAPRSGVRIPRTISKESITSVGADSGDDFASDGSSSRDDLPAQLLRRNDQIRRLEAKLSDYAEQLRIMQKTKDKLEIALERHQDLSIKKFQDQNETHQASRAKMAEGMTLALEKKDQEWIEKMADVEKEKTALSAQLEEMMEQSLALFQKRDDLDELEGFQQQELAKVKHMVRTYLKGAAVTEEDKERLLADLQKKVTSLDRRLQGNLSQDEHLQELLQEVKNIRTKTRSLPPAAFSSEDHASGQTRDDGVLCVVQVSYLEVEVDTLTEQLHSPEVCEEDQNGSVTVDDLDHIQKVNRELEQQLSDKNKTIKQLQQRLAELKRTLQKELKLKPDPEAEGKEKLLDSRAEKQERFCPEPPPASALSPPTSNTTVTNTSDLNDSREINFEYLKHVVLKFMSSREAEAFQLIRAVSVLLNFTREEEDMLKQTLEYKMSWFGSKPSPKGIIRPSVSGASSPWS